MNMVIYRISPGISGDVPGNRELIERLSKDFLDMKRRGAFEEEFAGWRKRIRNQQGLAAGGILEKVREHVLVMERMR